MVLQHKRTEYNNYFPMTKKKKLLHGDPQIYVKKAPP